MLKEGCHLVDTTPKGDYIGRVYTCSICNKEFKSNPYYEIDAIFNCGRDKDNG
tara:strand:+ start:2182 stop:2340 length:159 start_codon:yes stop_codon:yes gene_type:complete